MHRLQQMNILTNNTLYMKRTSKAITTFRCSQKLCSFASLSLAVSIVQQKQNTTFQWSDFIDLTNSFCKRNQSEEQQMQTKFICVRQQFTLIFASSDRCIYRIMCGIQFLVQQRSSNASLVFLPKCIELCDNTIEFSIRIENSVYIFVCICLM